MRTDETKSYTLYRAYQTTSEKQTGCLQPVKAPVRVIYASISDRVSAARLCIRQILPDTGHTPRKLPRRFASNLPLHRIYALSARPINIATDPLFVNKYFQYFVKIFSVIFVRSQQKYGGVLFTPVYCVPAREKAAYIVFLRQRPRLSFCRISARQLPAQGPLCRLYPLSASDPS